MMYFDNSATSRFKPKSVLVNTYLAIKNSANPGRSGYKESLRVLTMVEKTRLILQEYFFQGNVIFTKSCTEAINLAVVGSKLKNQVITTIYEHNAVLRPLKELERQNKIKLVIISPTMGKLETQLENHLQKPTSMVVLSGMSNVTGECMDVEKLARIVKEKSKAIVLVDMAQGAGHKNYDYTNIDAIAIAGHKGMHAVQGCGVLIAKEKLSFEPLIMGGTGSSSLSLIHPSDMPDSLEAGTQNTVGIIGLYYGAKWTFNNFEKINQKIANLHQYLLEKLKTIKNVKVIGGKNGIILLVSSLFSPSEFANKLDEYGICVRSGLHCAPLMHKYLKTAPNGGVRISIGYNNNFSQVKKLAKIIEELHKSQ